MMMCIPHHEQKPDRVQHHFILEETLVLWVGLIATYFLNQDLYIWLATEDALGENLTSLFYGIAAVLLLILPFRSPKKGRQSLQAFTLSTLLALLFIFVAGEEISWGQRIFNFRTPEALVDTNVQNEFNIHNLQFFDTESSILNQHTALNLFALGFGVLIPLLHWSVPPVRKFLDWFSFPIVPLPFVIFFVVGLAHGQAIAKLQTHWAHTEIKELIFSVGIVLFGISFFLNHSNHESKHEKHEGSILA